MKEMQDDAPTAKATVYFARSVSMQIRFSRALEASARSSSSTLRR